MAWVWRHSSEQSKALLEVTCPEGRQQGHGKERRCSEDKTSGDGWDIGAEEAFAKGKVSENNEVRWFQVWHPVRVKAKYIGEGKAFGRVVLPQHSPPGQSRCVDQEDHPRWCHLCDLLL